MSDLVLKTFNKLYPMMIRKYSDLIIDQNASEKDKINSIILKLNALGKLSNDVVRDWNTVYQWAMNDGLTTDVNNKLEDMLAKGQLKTITDALVAEIGDLTTLTTPQKDTVVHSINSLQSEVTTNTKDLNVRGINVMYPPTPLVSAKGDGVTDDTNYIQAIIDYVSSQGGGKVFIPPNYTFLVSTLKLNNKVEIVGAGVASILKGKDLTTSIITGLATTTGGIPSGTSIQDCKISNLQISGSCKYGIDLTYVYLSVIENVTFRNFTCDWGIYLDYAIGNKITNVTFTDSAVTSGCIKAINQSHALTINSLYTSLFAPTGILWDGGRGLNITQATLQGLDIGIYIMSTMGGGVSIIGSYCENNKTDIKLGNADFNKFSAGINIQGNAFAGTQKTIVLDYCGDFNITSNELGTQHPNQIVMRKAYRGEIGNNRLPIGDATTEQIPYIVRTIDATSEPLFSIKDGRYTYHKSSGYSYQFFKTYINTSGVMVAEEWIVPIGGTKEVSSLSITGGATTTADVVVTLNGVAKNVIVTTGDDAITVATKIRGTAFAGWITSGTGTTVTFTAYDGGVKTDSAFSAGTSGVVGTMTTITQGTDLT